MMRPLELRNAYKCFLEYRGYLALPERPLVTNEEAKTFFVGSALTPNLPVFLGQVPRPHNYLFTQQRVFWTRQASITQHNPLWTIFQVMMSFYEFQQTSIHHGLRTGLDFLRQEVGLEGDHLYLLTEPSLDIHDVLQEQGIPTSHVVEWPKMIQFHLDNLTGKYLKVLYRYRHGLIPVWDLIYTPDGDRIRIDSCLLLERLAFTLLGATTWFETELFLPLVQALQQVAPSLELSDVYESSVVFRGVVATIADGATPSNKGAGYVLRRTLRALVMDHMGKLINVQYDRLVPAAIECLAAIGYEISEEAEIARTIVDEVASIHKLRDRSYRFLSAYLTRHGQSLVTREMLAQWKDSRGIPIDMAEEFLQRHGVPVDTSLAPPRRRLLTDGYPYDGSGVMTDPIAWLNETGVLLGRK